MIVDAFSRFTWFYFFLIRISLLKHLESFIRKFKMKKKIENSLCTSDHGGDLKKNFFKTFFDENGIPYNFSCPIIPP